MKTVYIIGEKKVYAKLLCVIDPIKDSKLIFLKMQQLHTYFLYAHETPFEEQQTQQTSILSILLIYNIIQRTFFATTLYSCCRNPKNVAKRRFCCGMLREVAGEKTANPFAYNMLHLL